MQTDAQFWDKAADKYSKSKIDDPADYKRTLELTRSYLKPGDHVLELGAGTGGTARLLAPSVAQITATDISDRMTQISLERAAAEGVTNIRCLRADAASVDLADHSFDVVLAMNLLHLLPDPELTLRHAHRLLKPGGLFISKTPCLASGGLGMRLMMRLVVPVMQAFGKAPFVNALTEENLSRHVTEAGFQIDEANTSSGSTARQFIVARAQK